MQEAQALAATTATTGIAMLLAVLPLVQRPVPASTPLVGAAIALLCMLAIRWAYRRHHDRALRPDARFATPVLLFGIGSAGQGLLRAMLSDPRGRYLPVGLLDDDPEKRHLRVDGVPVLGGRGEIAAAVRQTGATTLILSVANADAALIRETPNADPADRRRVQGAPARPGPGRSPDQRGRRA